MSINVAIRAIQPDAYARAHAFQCEYLDKESLADFTQRVEAHPDLYLTAFVGQKLAGVCYGHPSERENAAVNLQGIAVDLDETETFARQGVGSKLIAAFEAAAKARGFRKVGLGAADDRKVERFYLKNGYRPCELVAKSSSCDELARVPISDYAGGRERQESLRAQLQAAEVIFIFEKTLG